MVDDILSASERISRDARQRLSQANVAPDNRAAVEAMVSQLVGEYQRLAAAGAEAFPLRDPMATIHEITGDIVGNSALDELVRNGAGIEDIFIEGGTVTYFRTGRLEGLAAPTTEASNRHFVNRLLADARVALDESHPAVHGVRVLAGRARLAVFIPPASPHLSADLRIFGGRHGDVDEMVEDDTLSGAAATFLRLVVRSKGSGLIGGETGSRKSTLLAGLLREVHPNHCIRLVEEAIELQFDPQHGGRYQVTGGDGAGSLTELIQGMLRMRPDIIAVGEVRGRESWDLAAASSVGAGFWATIHSRSAQGSLQRLIQTALMAGQNISERLIRDTFAESLDVVVHCEREDPNLVRDGMTYTAKVTEIRALGPSLADGQFSSDVIFSRPGGLRTNLVWTGQMPHVSLTDRLERLLPDGTTLHDVLTGTAGIA